MGIEYLVSFMPLYVEGLELALYLEMNEEAQKCVEKIEARLKETFMEREFMFYIQLEKIKWCGNK